MTPITLTVLINSKHQPVTFFSIDAISPDGPNTIIYSSGNKFLCEQRFDELYEKIKNLINESSTRK
jgi:uncharacterized protein YlzI (FlbEa/FlbD family)